jgi:hypothetical protein
MSAGAALSPPPAPYARCSGMDLWLPQEAERRIMVRRKKDGQTTPEELRTIALASRVLYVLFHTGYRPLAKRDKY